MVQILSDFLRNRVHVGQICASVVLRRRTYRYEDRLTSLYTFSQRRGEMQPSRLGVTLNHFFKPRLVNRNVAPIEELHLLRIFVHTYDGMS